jgi:Ni,Fe-hydrogenase III large subunit
MDYIEIRNNETIDLDKIPVHEYDTFRSLILSWIRDHDSFHCVNYFGIPEESGIRPVCLMADDETGTIRVLSYRLKNPYPEMTSMSNEYPGFNVFERELHENAGIPFADHPWLKPLRYPFNRMDLGQVMDNYPFFNIESEELHEVAVGPIHAGIIEPGHFRFICNGEQIIHLEIQHGYQHRGIEDLFLRKKKLNERITLSESIAGDTAVGHATAFCWLWESIHGVETPAQFQFERTLALELERMAIHTGDLAAICTDVAYQLGNAVLGRLRTPLVNFFQEWCGNRIAKSLVRPDFSYYPFTDQLATRLLSILTLYEKDLDEIWQRMKSLPSLLSRLERTGVVRYEQVRDIGAMGMAARMAGLGRDTRKSHPYGLYKATPHIPITKRHGDVYSRTQIRYEEIKQSMGTIR